MTGIGPSTKLAPLAETTSVAVADEQFVFNTLRGSVHRLSGTAATVWQILDGSASLLVLAGELADAYGADPAVVRELSLDDVPIIFFTLRGSDLYHLRDLAEDLKPHLESIPGVSQVDVFYDTIGDTGMFLCAGALSAIATILTIFVPSDIMYIRRKKKEVLAHHRK